MEQNAGAGASAEKPLSLQLYHIALIEKGIRQADAGEVVNQCDVKKMLTRLRRKR